MDSNPFQKNQTPFNPYQYPSKETIPSYTMMDPAESCMPRDFGHNSWYYGLPVPSYACCNGGNFFPGYYSFRPPHLPVPPHQHMHYYGGYPSCPELYYAQHAPPLHYNIEQPRYEFDKNMMRNHHCCGCSKSLCGQNQEDGKCVKIEEEKPDVLRKGSLVPIQLGNNQYAIVWIPPHYMGSKERKLSETGTAKQEKECCGSNSTENLKSVEKAPKFWSGWPLADLHHLGSWLPDAEGMGVRRVQNKQQEYRKKEFPFPLIWMPAFGTEETARKDVQMDVPTKYTVEPSDVGNLVPEDISQKDDATSEGPEVVKTINHINTPEMDMNLKTEGTNKGKERRCIPVETVKDNDKMESSRNNVKGQPSSKSMLPPVCLRVDPLPKKKNGNSSSRSLSSPTSIAAKENSQLDSKINNATAESDSERIIKAGEVKIHESPDGNQVDKDNIYRTGEPLSLPTQPQEKFFDKLWKVGTEEITRKEDKEENRTISHASTEKAVNEVVQEERKNEKPNLSAVEAAVLIQSAYRGYEVRKWELLKKMKELAEVRQQVIEVHNRVITLELAPQDEKERMFIGEMIMRLLLKLDTIQGLHPSVREFRKSLAKELVALQEKLDCMVINKPTEVVQEASMGKPAERFDLETHDGRKEEELLKDDAVPIGEIFPEGANESNFFWGQSHGAQPLCGIHDMACFEDMKSPAVKELQRPTGDGNRELPEVNDENTKVCESEQLVERREPGPQNEDTSEMFSQSFSQQFESEEVFPSLMEDKKPEEAESGAEMEQNIEMVADAEQNVGEVLYPNMEGETVISQAFSVENAHPAEDSLDAHASNSISDDQVGAQAGLTPQVLDKTTISAADENGQTEDQSAVDMELPMREDDNPNNFKADKLEHIEMRREVSDAEENTHDLAIELSRDRTPDEKQLEGQEGCHASSVGPEQNEECLSYRKCKNEKGESDEYAELSMEPSNFNCEVNIQNELITERNDRQTTDGKEKMLEDVQYPAMRSSESDNQAKRASDELAEFLDELPNSYHDEIENIQNKMVTGKKEQQTSDEKKMAEDVQSELCVLDHPMPASKLDNQANELHAAGEATLDGAFIEIGGESMPASPKHDLGSDKEMDKSWLKKMRK